jgi:hypothetical protein
VFVILINPFSDYLQRWSEIAMTVLTIASVCFLFPFVRPDLSVGAITGITIVFAILNLLAAVVALTFFIVSTAQAFKIFSFKQLCSKSRRNN